MNTFFIRNCPESSGESSLLLQTLEEDCIWSIKTDAGLKSHTITFQLNEWVDDVTMDGRNIKTKFHYNNGDRNTLVEFQMSDGVNTTLTRQFFADRMEVYMNVNAVNASSLFRRNTS